MQNENNKTIQLKVGQTTTLKASVHASVGMWADILIADESVVIKEREETVYNHPENMGNGMTGGDAAVLHFFFLAKKAGTTAVTVTNNFRGVPESPQVYRIVVG